MQMIMHVDCPSLLPKDNKIIECKWHSLTFVCNYFKTITNFQHAWPQLPFFTANKINTGSLCKTISNKCLKDQ